MQIDLSGFEGAFDKVGRKISFEYRDPMLAPYGNPDKMTATQKKAWPFLKKWTGMGPLIAMIAAKGAAKTHFGACFAWHQGQTFPESLGCLVSNTFGQAKDNGLPPFLSIGRALGYDVEYFEKKKIRGKPYTNVAIARLSDDIYFYLLLRSYDAIQNFEGVEIDWWWSEEGQDTTYDNYSVPFSRNRGKYGDNAHFYAAMPADEAHFQYTKLPLLGMTEEAKFVEPPLEEVQQSRIAGNDPIEVGIMYEYSVYENRMNVGSQYIARNSLLYTGAMYDRYVLGKRGSSTSSRLFDRFSRGVHVLGFLPQLLSGMDPVLPVVLICDFNAAPCCMTLWQGKKYSDIWGQKCYIGDDGNPYLLEDDSLVEDLTRIAVPNRNVYMQVGEAESWQGGTRGAVAQVIEILRENNFKGTLYVNGDATGNSMRSSASATDWDIVKQTLFDAGFDAQVQPGLIVNYPDVSSGKPITYQNPPRQDTISLSNLMLEDGHGRVHVAFLKSELESGGCAGSVEGMLMNPDGQWNVTVDKKPGKDVARTHFADTFRYLSWWVTNGAYGYFTDESMDGAVQELIQARKMAHVQEKYGINQKMRDVYTPPPPARSKIKGYL